MDYINLIIFAKYLGICADAVLVIKFIILDI